MQVIRQLLQIGLALAILTVCVNWLFGRGKPGWLRHKVQIIAYSLLCISSLILLWNFWPGHK